VREGTILEIDCHRVKEGTTSVSYEVAVREGRGNGQRVIFSTQVSFVNVDQTGAKRPLKNYD
jgi:acyl-CoA hydrolase